MALLEYVDIFNPRKGKSRKMSNVGLTAAVIGEIFNQNEVASFCNIEPPKNSSDLLLCMYKRGLLHHLDKVNGLFCAFIADEKDRSLHLITDRYASFPLHLYSGTRGFIFGTSIFTMLADGSIPRRPCEVGVAQLFSLQRTLGSYTNISNLHALTSGSITTLGVNGVSLKKYWNLQYNDKNLSDSEMAERLATALKQPLITNRLKEQLNLGYYCQVESTAALFWAVRKTILFLVGQLQVTKGTQKWPLPQRQQTFVIANSIPSWSVQS